MTNWTEQAPNIYQLKLGAYTLTLKQFGNGWIIHLLPTLLFSEPIGKFDNLTDAKTKAIEVAKGKLQQVYQDAMEALK